jgi:hypothetical protein
MQELEATRPSLKTHRVSLAAKHHPNSTSFLLCSLDTPLPRYQPRYFVNFTRLTITTFPLSHIQIPPKTHPRYPTTYHSNSSWRPLRQSTFLRTPRSRSRMSTTSSSSMESSLVSLAVHAIISSGHVANMRPTQPSPMARFPQTSRLMLP